VCQRAAPAAALVAGSSSSRKFQSAACTSRAVNGSHKTPHEKLRWSCCHPQDDGRPATLKSSVGGSTLRSANMRPWVTPEQSLKPAAEIGRGGGGSGWCPCNLSVARKGGVATHRACCPSLAKAPAAGKAHRSRDDRWANKRLYRRRRTKKNGPAAAHQTAAVPQPRSFRLSARSQPVLSTQTVDPGPVAL